MRKLANTSLLFAAFGVVGCVSVSPSTYKAVGAIGSEPIAVEITRPAPIKGTSATVSFNGEEVLVTKRFTRITSNPNCQRLSIYAYRCEDDGTYKGKQVSVVEEWSANKYAGYAHFDIYVDRRLIQRVEATGGY